MQTADSRLQTEQIYVGADGPELTAECSIRQQELVANSYG